MKASVLVFTLLTTGAALGYSNVTINWPSVNGLPVNNACATAETFRSIKPVQVCAEKKTVRYALSNHTGEVGQTRRLLQNGEELKRGEWLVEESVCTAFGSKHMEVSRDYQVSECAYYPRAGEASEPCTQLITKTKKSGLRFSVEKLVEYGDATMQSWIEFTVPMCK